MTLREERIATLRRYRAETEIFIRWNLDNRHIDRQYDHRGVVLRDIAWCRILDAKIASLRGAR